MELATASTTTAWEALVAVGYAGGSRDPQASCLESQKPWAS